MKPSILNNVYYCASNDEVILPELSITIELCYFENPYLLGSIYQNEWMIESEIHYAMSGAIRNYTDKPNNPQLVEIMDNYFYLIKEKDNGRKYAILWPDSFFPDLLETINNLRKAEPDIPVFIFYGLNYGMDIENPNTAPLLNQISTHLIPLHYLLQDYNHG